MMKIGLVTARNGKVGLCPNLIFPNNIVKMFLFFIFLIVAFYTTGLGLTQGTGTIIINIIIIIIIKIIKILIKFWLN